MNLHSSSDHSERKRRLRMSRLSHFAIFVSAAVHLLLFSICPVSSRIYQTNDAIVIEVDDVRSSNLPDPSSILSERNQFGIPAPISMAYAVNPFTGLYHQQQPNFPFWPYPLYRPATTASDVTSTSPESKQQKIACGVGPDSPPARKSPTVGIVGGSDATPNSWPFVVGLRKLGLDTVFCGGSLISTTRVLTAAHCVDKLSAFDISTMTVSLGMHTQGGGQNIFNDAQQTRKVSRVIYHKDYNSKTNFNDIAVLTFDPPVSYSSAISPVCLPSFNNAVDQFVDKDAAIMGWGTLKSGGTQPNVLQQATVKVISNADCDVQYGGDKVLNQQLCASAPGKDTCQGDSGGPLVVQAKEGSTSWTQVGVTSYGRGCADPNFAGVYASVAFFRKWINTYMNS